ncbi:MULTISPECIES: MFS transporter [Streptomyces]|uniref:MFS transporter n=1 Tax=Streptomyces TaxID=1883 RepID=UPI000ABCC1FB|nr:MFS transporter [Streptomyces virginiae]
MAEGKRRVLAPLALAQFTCSFAGSNMNVMINGISEDLDTTVQGVQVAITIFLLVTAALMIPGGKLTDKWGRKRCLLAGLVVYGVGAVISAAAPGLGVLDPRELDSGGCGHGAADSSGLHPDQGLLFTDKASRARAFGAIMAMGGIAAAADPLIGGLITSAISWRAAFVFQALVIVVLSRKIDAPLPPDPARPFDTVGAVLSAGGLVLLVTGTLAVDNNGWLAMGLLLAGALVLVGFFASMRGRERVGREVLPSTALFRNRTSNLGLVTQNTQWLRLMGVSFTVAAYLQVVRGYDAIETGVIFTAGTLGILASSPAAEKLARRRAQRTLIMAGFIVTIAGIAVLIALVAGSPSAWAFTPGLLLIGLGLQVMLTPSVNVVQPCFPETQQGEISGLSRSISSLGSSLGTAVAGTILVSGLSTGAYAAAMAALAVVGVGGLIAGALLPRAGRSPAAGAGTAAPSGAPQQ